MLLCNRSSLQCNSFTIIEKKSTKNLFCQPNEKLMNWKCGICDPCHYNIRRNVFRNNASSSHNCIIANDNAGNFCWKKWKKSIYKFTVEVFANSLIVIVLWPPNRPNPTIITNCNGSSQFIIIFVVCDNCISGCIKS